MDRAVGLTEVDGHRPLAAALSRVARPGEVVDGTGEHGAALLWFGTPRAPAEALAALETLADRAQRGQALVVVSSLHACLPADATALERPLRLPFDPVDELCRWRAHVEQEAARAGFADERVEAEQAVRARHEQLRAPVTGPGFVAAAAAETTARSAARSAAWLAARATRAGYRSTLGYVAALAEGLATTGAGPAGIVRVGTVWPAPGDDETLWDAAWAASRARADGRGKLVAAASDTVARLCWAAAAAVHTGQAVVVHAAVGPEAVVPEARIADLFSLAAQGPVQDGAAWLQSAGAETFRQVTGHRLVRGLLDKTAPAVAAWLPPPVNDALTARDADPLFFGPGFRPLARKAGALLRGAYGEAGLAAEQTPLRRRVLDEIAPRGAPRPAVAPAAAAPVRYRSTLHMLETAAARYSTRNALSVFEGDQKVSVTYQGLLRRARQTATRLAAAGVGPGDRVLLSGRNGPAWPIAFFGIQIAGAVPVPVDPGLEPSQVRAIVQKARPKGAILDGDARQKFADAAPAPDWDLMLFTAEGGAAHDVPAPGGDEVASILFTSGTTGTPKGVMLTHKNFAAQAAALSVQFDMTGEDRGLSVLPLHHTLEFSCGLLLPLVAGAEIFYLDELNADRLAYCLQQGRITGMVGVPALWQLIERKIRRELDAIEGTQKTALSLLSVAERAWAARTGRSAKHLLYKPVHDALGGHLRLLISGGAALPSTTQALFAEVGLPLREGYGLTETAPVLAVAAEDDPVGTVGRPILGVELRIAGDGETGEILARGDNVMAGYFEDEAATRAVLDDEGWLRTGDIGRLDEGGRLVIVGRAKEVVVTASGENVYLDDVEELLRPFDAAAEFCLLGVPAEGGGELLALAVVPHEGQVLTAAEAKRHTARLPAYARPAVVEVFDTPLPKTATRKVKRKDVRALVEERLRRADAGPDAAPAVTSVAFARVQAAVALVVGQDRATLTPATHLHTDLGFDSLMWVELAEALTPLFGSFDAEALFACDTLADLEQLVAGPAPAPAADPSGPDEGEQAVALPRFFVAAGRAVLSAGQRELYRTLFDSEVFGRGHIPYNTNAIVVANHCSHLDTGLVKFALGRYGTDLLPLAAADYFFEGHRAKVAFFEHFTNLVALDRTSGSGSAFEVARGLLKEGHAVLIYPEGTRRADGTLGPFKPLVGRLAMATGVPVLPIGLRGTYAALPRGAAMVRSRALSAHIGAPLDAATLRDATAHLRPVEAAKAATEMVRHRLAEVLAGRGDAAPAAGSRRSSTRTSAG